MPIFTNCWRVAILALFLLAHLNHYPYTTHAQTLVNKIDSVEYEHCKYIVWRNKWGQLEAHLMSVDQRVRDTLRSFHLPDSINYNGNKIRVSVFYHKKNDLFKEITSVHINSRYDYIDNFTRNEFPKLDTLYMPMHFLVEPRTEDLGIYAGQETCIKNTIDQSIFSTVTLIDDGSRVERIGPWLYAHDSTLLSISSHYPDSILVLPEHITCLSSQILPTHSCIKHLVLGPRVHDLNSSGDFYRRNTSYLYGKDPQIPQVENSETKLYAMPYRRDSKTSDYIIFSSTVVNLGYILRQNYKDILLRISSKHWGYTANRKIMPEAMYLPAKGNTTTVSTGVGGAVAIHAIDLRNYPKEIIIDTIHAEGSRSFEAERDQVFLGLPYRVKALSKPGYEFKFFIFRKDTIFSSNFIYVPLFPTETIQAHFEPTGSYTSGRDYKLSVDGQTLVRCHMAPVHLDLSSVAALSRVERIAPHAFSCNSNTKELILPENVKEIDRGWFNYGTPLRVLVCPAQIQSIAPGALEPLNDLRYLIFKEKPAVAVEAIQNAFKKNFAFSKLTIIVPENSTEQWKKDLSARNIPCRVLPFRKEITLEFNGDDDHTVLELLYRFNGEDFTTTLSHREPKRVLPFGSLFSVKPLRAVSWRCTSVVSDTRSNDSLAEFYSGGFAITDERLTTRNEGIFDSVRLPYGLHRPTGKLVAFWKMERSMKFSFMRGASPVHNMDTLLRGSTIHASIEAQAGLRPLHFLHEGRVVALDSNITVLSNLTLTIVYDSILHNVKFEEAPNTQLSIRNQWYENYRHTAPHMDTLSIDIDYSDPHFTVDTVAINGVRRYPDNPLPIKHVLNGDIEITYAMRTRYHGIVMDEPAETFLSVTNAAGQTLHNGDSIAHGEDIQIIPRMDSVYTTKAVTIYHKFNGTFQKEKTLNVSKYSNRKIVRTIERPIKLHAYGKCSVVTYTVDYPQSEKGGEIQIEAKTLKEIKGKFHVNAKDTLRIHVIPFSGYELKSWSINGIPQSKDAVAVAITENVSIAVDFQQKKYTISYPTHLEGGTLSVTGEDGRKISSQRELIHGYQININAEPKKGYQLDYIKGNDTIDLKNGCRLYLSHDLTITCAFKPRPDTLIGPMLVDGMTGFLKKWICASDSASITDSAIVGILPMAISYQETPLRALHIGAAIQRIQGKGLVGLDSLERLYFTSPTIELQQESLQGLDGLRKIHLLNKGAQPLKLPNVFRKRDKRKPPIYLVVPRDALVQHAECNSQRIIVVPETALITFQLMPETELGKLEYSYTDLQRRTHKGIIDAYPHTVSIPGGATLYWKASEDPQYNLHSTITTEGKSIEGDPGLVPTADMGLILLFAKNSSSSSSNGNNTNGGNTNGSNENGQNQNGQNQPSNTAPADTPTIQVQEQPNALAFDPLTLGIINPVKDHTIRFLEGLREAHTFSLHNVQGHILMNGALPVGAETIELPASLPTGIYILHLHSAEGSFVVRLWLL